MGKASTQTPDWASQMPAVTEQQLASLVEKNVVRLEPTSKPKSKEVSDLGARILDKELLKEIAFPYIKIFKHFNKLKSIAYSKNNGCYSCKSPFNPDSDESFIYGDTGWKDPSSGKIGKDYFDLIADLYNVVRGSAEAKEISVKILGYSELKPHTKKESNTRKKLGQLSKGKFPRTDLGNAERFRDQAQGAARYCEAWASWLVYNGKFWAKSELEAYKVAKRVIRSIYKEAEFCVDDFERKELGKHAINSERAQAIKSMLSLARSEEGISIKPNEIDANLNLFNVENGTLDLRTGKLLPHNPDNLISKISPVNFDASAECPTWLRFLNEVFQGDKQLIEFVQRAAGYSLTGDISERAIFFLFGVGKNGKSTFVETLSHVLGEDFAVALPAESLTIKKADGAVPNDIAKLKGARFVSSREMEEGRRLAEARVKELTGNEKITARFMRADFFDFTPECKIWLSTNHKPIIRGDDQAIWDRIKLIPFKVRFTKEQQDCDLQNKLRAEASGILNWLLEGCMKWRAAGLGVASAIDEATGSYQQEMDLVGNFLSERCEEKSDLRVNCSDLFQAYKTWCDQDGIEPLSQPMFSKKLQSRGYESKAGAGNRKFYFGLVLKP